MTDRRAHPARLARVATGGLSAAATFAMVAAMGLPAGADPVTAGGADGSAVAGTSASTPTAAGDRSRVLVVVRRHRDVAGPRVAPAGASRSLRTRAPAPARATQRTTRSGGS
jgi:hypothetical protein